jgi:hypothetical protein
VQPIHLESTAAKATRLSVGLARAINTIELPLPLANIVRDREEEEEEDS